MSVTKAVESGYLRAGRNWRLLKSQRRIQETAFGVDYMELTGNDLADYMQWNALAAMFEIGEAFREIGWKPWAKGRGWVNRQRALEELVDAQLFLANMLAALEVDDDEFESAIQSKQDENVRRQRDGYDGRN